MGSALQPQNLIANIVGVGIGIFFGALPGVGAVLTVGLFIGVTFALPPATGLIFLGALYSGAVYGGSISAILVNTPGTAASTATTFDGYPMAEQGRARVALGASMMSSFIGGIFGCLALITLGPVLGMWAVYVGPAEYVGLAIFTLTTIASLSREDLLKGLVAGALGILLSTAGHDPITGIIRYDFGIEFLEDGVPLVPALIGLFAIPEAFLIAQTGGTVSKVGRLAGDIWEGISKTFVHLVTLIRSVLFGVGLGILPGVGGAIANMVAYSETVRRSKDPDSFGKGNIEGVIAPEAANNATVASSLIPTLTLGIPGSDVAAVFLGGLIIHGIFPGPDLFTSQASITYTFFAGLVFSQIIMFAMAVFAAPLYARITLLSGEKLVPLILVLSLAGAFSYRNNVLDMMMAVGFGVFAYLMRWAGFPRAALVLGLVLGKLVERNYNRAMIISEDSFSIFVTEPLSLAIVVLIFVTLLYPVISEKIFPQNRK